MTSDSSELIPCSFNSFVELLFLRGEKVNQCDVQVLYFRFVTVMLSLEAECREKHVESNVSLKNNNNAIVSS